MITICLFLFYVPVLRSFAALPPGKYGRRRNKNESGVLFLFFAVTVWDRGRIMIQNEDIHM